MLNFDMTEHTGSPSYAKIALIGEGGVSMGATVHRHLKCRSNVRFFALQRATV